MTEKELEIAVAAHEMQRLELKEAFGAETVESACAFANAQGGYIVIGVDDKGRLAKSPLRSEALRDYENRIATATEPSVAVDAEKVSFRSGQVVVLKVSKNPLKPVAQAFYDMHLIEHYGSGIRRIKDECDANGNVHPIWRDNLGTFSTTYLSRNASSGTINGTINQGDDTINEGINAPREIINDTISLKNDTINAQSDTINQEDDTIKRKLLDTIIQKEGIKRDVLAEAIQRSIPTVARLLADLEHDGKIIYRGSKKTGGYYAVKQED